MQFTKPPLTYEQQIMLLLSRGMIIQDHARARRFLSHLNYYRLATYWHSFEQDHLSHTFKAGTTFDLVVEHYIFDRELRLLVMDAIERLEVSLRSQWAYYLAHTYGAHAHLNASIFKPFKQKWDHADNVATLKDTVRKSSETFIRHFRTIYDEELPPIWAVCEMMTFGQLSRWYANLQHGYDRNAIARVYNMDETNLVSFIHGLSIVRNYCAHHSSLWNRELPIAWKLPSHRPHSLVVNLNRADRNHLYNTIATLAYLMDILNPGHHWKQRLRALFDHHSCVDGREMGFPDNWQKLPLWSDVV
jgi:abortive infection bacteriophage resistance protein